jgi:hypothetical protein
LIKICVEIEVDVTIENEAKEIVQNELGWLQDPHIIRTDIV